MRMFLRFATFAVLLVTPIALWSCISIPTMADRVVELVTTTSVGDTLHADGTANINTDIGAFDVNDLDIAGILGNAGIDVSSVTGISLASVQYQIVRADPTPSR